MKKIILFALLFVSLGLLNGQSTYFQHKNVLKVNPVEFSRAEFKVAYERYFADRKHSILINPTIILKNDDEDVREGWRLMGQYRYYLSHLNHENGNAILGMYNTAIYGGAYGLYLNYQDRFMISYFEEETSMSIQVENERKITAQETGVIFGVQFDITKRFVLDFYVGGGVRFSDEANSFNKDVEFFAPDRGGVYPYEYQGVKPTVGLMIGLTL